MHNLVRHKATPTQLYVAQYLKSYLQLNWTLRAIMNLIATDGRCACGECELD